MITVSAVGAPNLRARFEMDQDPQGKWLTGHFLLEVQGRTVGNWDDFVSLALVRDHMRALLEFAGRRWDDKLAGMDPERAYRVLFQAGYADRPMVEIADAIEKFDVTHIGATAFDRLTLMLIDASPGKEWLGWGSGGTAAQPDVVEWAQLGRGELSLLAAEIVTQLSRYEPGATPNGPDGQS